jgi:hypothetical protein
MYLSGGIRSHRGCEELASFNSSALVDPARLAREAIGYDLAPRNVSIPLHHGVSLAPNQSLFGKQGSVNSTIDNPRSPATRDPSDFISTQGITGMYTDADDIPRHNALGHNLFQGFINENGIASDKRRSRSKYKQPSWRDDGGAEGIIAGIYEMNAIEPDLSLFAVECESA